MRDLLFFPEQLDQPIAYARCDEQDRLVFVDSVAIARLSAHYDFNTSAVVVVLPGQ